MSNRKNTRPSLPYIRHAGRLNHQNEKENITNLRRFEVVAIHNGRLKTDILVEHVKQLNLPLGSKIICIPGGVGRHAESIRQLGYDVTNLDRHKEYINIGKKNYPEVHHLLEDYNKTWKYVGGKFDLAFFEDMISCSYDEEEFQLINAWSKVCDVYPKIKKLKLFRFNSRLVDQMYTYPEPEVNQIIQEQMAWGELEMRVTVDEVDDYDVKDIECRFPEWEITVPSCEPDFKYQMLGTWLDNDALGHNVGFMGMMCGKGFHRKMLRKNKKDYGMINIDT